jgi:hypothetical protein
LYRSQQFIATHGTQTPMNNSYRLSNQSANIKTHVPPVDGRLVLHENRKCNGGGGSRNQRGEGDLADVLGSEVMEHRRGGHVEIQRVATADAIAVKQEKPAKKFIFILPYRNDFYTSRHLLLINKCPSMNPKFAKTRHEILPIQHQ